MSRFHIVNIAPHYAPALADLQRAVFPMLGEQERLKEEHFLSHYHLFPQGNFVALAHDGRVVGLGSGFLIDFNFDYIAHNFNEMVGGGWYSNHDPRGEWYYGGDISVHPDFRRKGIGRMLYNARKECVIKLNRKGIVAAGRIPAYSRHPHLSAETFVAKVIAGELYDPTLSMQLRNGFAVRAVLPNYLEDEESANYAALIAWLNPYYKPTYRPTSYTPE